MSDIEKFPKCVMMPTICPYCKKEFDCEVYPEIVIPGDNKLKKKILNKTMFFPKCPHCGDEFKIKGKCMYRNENKKEWFIVTDLGESEIETMMMTGDIRFNDVHTDDDMMGFMKGLYKRRVVHDVDSFREKILLSEYNYDDRIIELMKLSLSGLLEQENHTPVYRIFLEESSGNMFEFTAIMGSQPPFEYVSAKTPASVYTQFKDKYLDKLGRSEDDEYISTDQKWAKKSGLLKDDNAGFVIPM